MPEAEDGEQKIDRTSSVDDPFLRYVYREYEMPTDAEDIVVQTIWKKHKILIVVGSSIGGVVLIVLLFSAILSLKSRVSANNSNSGSPQELNVKDDTEQKFSFREQRVISLFMKSEKWKNGLFGCIYRKQQIFDVIFIVVHLCHLLMLMLRDDNPKVCRHLR